MPRRSYASFGIDSSAEFPAKKNASGTSGGHEATDTDERRVWAGYINVYQLYACLIDAPYHLTFSAIADLTDRQIYDLYYRARDKDGSPEPIDDPEAEWQRKEAPADLDTAEERARAHSKLMTMALTFDMSPAKAEQQRAEAQAKNGN